MQQEETKTQTNSNTGTVDTTSLYNNPLELEKILFALTQPDNNELKRATIVLTDFLAKPQSVLPLLQQLEGSQKPEVRQMAAIYLREQVEHFWKKIPSEVQTKVKSFLISKLGCEYRPERLAVAACIASVGKFELISNEWDSLLTVLSKMCEQNSKDELREIGVTIWRNLIHYCGGALKKHFGIILKILQSTLNETEKSLKTQVESVKAIGLMVEFLENENEINIIEDVIPSMCAVIERCLKAGDEDNVLSGMEVFNDLAESKIPILNKHAKQLVAFNMSIASAKGKLPMTIRKQAVNFIGWIVNSKPRTVIKNNFLKQFLQLGINLVLESVDETDNTNNANNQNNDEEKDAETAFNSLLAMGCDLLDEIFKGLPGETVFSMGIQAIEALMNENNDRSRQAGYTVMAMMVEGCDEMIARGNNLSILLESSLKGSKDSNPMIRKCALEAITQLATHMHYKVLPHHKTILPALFSVFDRENEDIRVVERALNAIEMFIDAFTDADEDDRVDFKIELYAPKVMQIVEKCLKYQVNELRVQSLTTIASVASASQEKFQPYLDGTLRLLEQAMLSTGPVDTNNNAAVATNLDVNAVALRSEATSCLGAVALAVGFEVYKPYMLKFHKTVMDGLTNIDDSSLRESTFIYFSELAKLMGTEITELESFEDMLVTILWIMGDDDGVQVKLPDDGFGGSSRVPTGRLFQDLKGVSADEERLINLALEETKLDDLQNMTEEELTAYLKKTMENAAQLENDEDEFEDDDDDEDDPTKQIAASVGQLKTVKISVRTGFMEEKAAAIHCLTQLIRHGGNNMLENMETCFDALLRLWDYPHQLVKMALINCFHAFFECVVNFSLKTELSKNSGNAIYCKDGVTLKYNWKQNDLSFKNIYDDNIKQFIEEMFPLYIQSIIDEDDNDTLNILIDNFIEEMRILGASSIDEYMKDLVSAIKQFLNGKTALNQTGDDLTDEDTKKIITKHKFVSDAIAELIATMAELWGVKSIEIWKEIFPSLLKFGAPNRHPHDRAMVVGCIADFCSQLAKISDLCENETDILKVKSLMSPYSDECFKLSLIIAQSTDVNMRQNALYCIGALFTACNQQSNLQHCNDCLRCLQVYIKFPNNGTRQEQLVRDNAVSALGKVIISEPEALPAKDLLSVYVNSLPLTCDFSENKYVYDVIMKLILNEQELIKPHIQQTLILLSNALPDQNVDPSTTEKIVMFFRKICSDKGIQTIVKTLAQENQANIMKALNTNQS